MAITGTLTPSQLNAGASLLQNQGIGPSPALSSAINAYLATPLITAFYNAINAGADIAGITATTCPALSNSVPTAYASLGTFMTTTAYAQAVLDSGSGDISKFCQALGIAQAYNSATNTFVNSAVNSQTYLGNTFTSTNNMISGDVTTINLATDVFGSDLSNLGNLIDLTELNDLGNPLSVIQRIVEITGNIPVLSLLLLAEGVSEDIVLSLTNPTLSVTDSVQKLMYQAMTKVTDTALAQVLKGLKITTANISNMADLLNPVKLFPNSFQSLTVNTANGVRAVYINAAGSVNTNLLTELPDYVIAAYNRLQQIIPPDQALANKALGVALTQINGLTTINLPNFSKVVSNIETTRNLPLITALTQAVPASVASYYSSNLANGTGVNNNIRIVDVLGLAGGWVATDAFLNTITVFGTMNLTTLTTIYQTMANANSGAYGSTTAGPLTIPGGLPCAGTYLGVEIPPVPPETLPTYNPTALELAMTCLELAAATEVANILATYPSQVAQLNSLSNSIGAQITLEKTLQTKMKLVFAQLSPNNSSSIYSFIFSLPSYGNQTEVGGVAWLIESMANLSTFGGQAVVACLREGRNLLALGTGGLYTNTTIPSDPNPPPAQATLLPSTYSESEAENLVVK